MTFGYDAVGNDGDGIVTVINLPNVVGMRGAKCSFWMKPSNTCTSAHTMNVFNIESLEKFVDRFRARMNRISVHRWLMDVTQDVH